MCSLEWGFSTRHLQLAWLPTDFLYSLLLSVFALAALSSNLFASCFQLKPSPVKSMTGQSKTPASTSAVSVGKRMRVKTKPPQQAPVVGVDTSKEEDLGYEGSCIGQAIVILTIYLGRPPPYAL